MAASISIELESGTSAGRVHPHNGYYAGDFDSLRNIAAQPRGTHRSPRSTPSRRERRTLPVGRGPRDHPPAGRACREDGGRALSPTGVGAVDDSDDGDLVAAVVDAVDDSIGSASGAVSVGQRRVESPAHSMRVVQQRADDERIGGERNGLGQNLRQLSPSNRRR